MLRFTITLLIFAFGISHAQQGRYSTANAHSHNDYEKPNPFHDAFSNKFGSIEADIFLLDDGKLYVAHTLGDLNNNRRTLDSLYLQPLVNCIRKNKGSVYPDPSLRLQLLIDIKTAATPTLNGLVIALERYPELIRAASLKIVISGNRPQADSFHLYPSYIYFDGVIGAAYSPQTLLKIEMFSASFRNFSRWTGYDTIPANERNALLRAVSEAHTLGKPVRFWAAPDHPRAWRELQQLGVDYINTDYIEQLAEFLNGEQ